MVLSLLLPAAALAQAGSGKAAPASASPAATQAAPKPPGASTAPAARPSPAADAKPSAIDPSKEADIRKLMDVVGAKSMTTDLMRNMVDNMKPVLSNSLPPGDYRAKLIDLFFDKFLARANVEFPKLEDSAVSVYDKYLSDEDIKGLIQFYQTPLGQKTLTVLPKIVVEMQQNGQKLGQQIGQESMMEVLSEHPDLAKQLDEAGKAAGSR